MVIIVNARKLQIYKLSLETLLWQWLACCLIGLAWELIDFNAKKWEESLHCPQTLPDSFLVKEQISGSTALYKTWWCHKVNWLCCDIVPGLPTLVLMKEAATDRIKHSVTINPLLSPASTGHLLKPIGSYSLFSKCQFKLTHKEKSFQGLLQKCLSLNLEQYGVTVHIHLGVICIKVHFFCIAGAMKGFIFRNASVGHLTTLHLWEESYYSNRNSSCFQFLALVGRWVSALWIKTFETRPHEATLH